MNQRKIHKMFADMQLANDEDRRKFDFSKFETEEKKEAEMQFFKFDFRTAPLGVDNAKLEPDPQ